MTVNLSFFFELLEGRKNKASRYYYLCACQLACNSDSGACVQHHLEDWAVYKYPDACAGLLEQSTVQANQSLYST